MNRRFALPLAALLLVAAAGLGCKTRAAIYAGETSAQLFQDGRDKILQGRFEDGRTRLRFIEENMPQAAEFSEAKLMLGDSYFFQGSASYPEALVEYQSFLNYFPRHERRDYVLYHIALCHYASIDNAERDQTETKAATGAFNRLLAEAPGSPYVVEAKAKLVQCWRRIAEHEVVVGVFYVNSYNYLGAEKRLKGALEQYPDYTDRERAYYYLGEALRQKSVPPFEQQAWAKEKLAGMQKEEFKDLNPEEQKVFLKDQAAFAKQLQDGYRQEAKGYYQKLVESYPHGDWARKASDRLLELGTQGIVKEELDM